MGIADKVIVTGSTEGKLVLSDSASGKQLSTLPGHTGAVSCSSLSAGQRFLASGGVDGLVKIWDLKQTRISLEFTQQDCAITGLSYAANDATIGVGNAVGRIGVFNPTTGQQMLSVVNESRVSINALQYSNLRKTWIGACSADGSVIIVDAATGDKTAAGPVLHNAAATAISFSPINHRLMVSAGLDNKILCFDAVDRKCVRQIVADAPLSALTFMRDGRTLAAGTADGRILVFDLRGSNTPMKTLDAHKSTVYSLSAAYDLSSTTTTSQTSASATKTTSSTPLTQSVESAKPTLPGMGAGDGVLSPIGSHARPAVESTRSSIPTIPSRYDNQSTTSSVVSSHTSLPQTSAPVSHLPQPSVTSSYQSSKVEPVSTAPPALSKPISKPVETAGSAPEVSHSYASRTTGDHNATSAPSHSVPSVQQATVRSSLDRDQSATIPKPSAMIKPSTEVSSYARESVVDNSAVGGSAIGSAVLKNIIEEATAALRDSLHADVRALHLDMIRQLHGLQTVLDSAMSQSLQKQSAMEEDIRTLRDEVRRLRHPY